MPSTPELIQAALIDQRPIRFSYAAAGDATHPSRAPSRKQRRTVSPYELTENALMAWDHDREAIRTFKVARITEPEVAPRLSYVEPVV